MAVEFAKAGLDVKYVSPGYVHRKGEQVESGLELPKGLSVAAPPALPGSGKLDLVGKFNEASLLRVLEKEARSEPWDIVVFNDPRFVKVAQKAAGGQTVWDCMDDLSLSAPDEERFRQAEEMTLEVADRVWTGTPSLEERFKSRHPQVKFVACGVDAERFAKADAAEVEKCREELREWRGRGAEDAARPLAGYFGALNERLDATYLEALLEEGWDVLLIGPGSSRRPTLPKSDRLLWIGPKPYATLPAYLAMMDVALIPYDTQGANRFLYPVKALEYLAGGVPVLSTALPDVAARLGYFVTIGEKCQDWVNFAKDWRKMPTDILARTAKGQQYAKQRSWAAMVEEMRRDLARPLPGRNY